MNTMLDPVAVAYRQHGTTTPDKSLTDGLCCRCGMSRRLVPTRSVVSAKFTGFDEFQTGQGLCISCAWAFSTAARRLTLNITPKGSTLLDTPSLYDRLLRPSHSAALVVPLSGRKHVLPYARWGTVRVDDINIVWRASDVGRLKLVAELRERGASAPTLAEPTPPWKWLSSQPRELWEATHRQWHELDPWRSTPHLDLAIKATHHLKGNRL